MAARASSTGLCSPAGHDAQGRVVDAQRTGLQCCGTRCAESVCRPSRIAGALPCVAHLPIPPARVLTLLDGAQQVAGGQHAQRRLVGWAAGVGEEHRRVDHVGVDELQGVAGGGTPGV